MRSWQSYQCFSQAVTVLVFFTFEKPTYFIYICVLPACVYGHHEWAVPVEARGGHLDSLGTGIIDCDLPAIWVLGTKPEFSARASAPNL